MSDLREETEDKEFNNPPIEDIPEDGGEDLIDDLTQTTENEQKAFLDRGLTTK